MTKLEVAKRLKDGESLTTGMCESIGVSFDNFLRFAQLSDEERKRIESRLSLTLEIIGLSEVTDRLGHCSQ